MTLGAYVVDGAVVAGLASLLALLELMKLFPRRLTLAVREPAAWFWIGLGAVTSVALFAAVSVLKILQIGGIDHLRRPVAIVGCGLGGFLVAANESPLLSGLFLSLGDVRKGQVETLKMRVSERRNEQIVELVRPLDWNTHKDALVLCCLSEAHTNDAETRSLWLTRVAELDSAAHQPLSPEDRMIDLAYRLDEAFGVGSRVLERGVLRVRAGIR